MKLRAANYSAMTPLGTVNVKVEMNDENRCVEFIVVDKFVPKVIGGVDLQKMFGIRWSKLDTWEEWFGYQSCENIRNFGKVMNDEQRLNGTLEVQKNYKTSKLYDLIERHNGRLLDYLVHEINEASNSY